MFTLLSEVLRMAWRVCKRRLAEAGGGDGSKQARGGKGKPKGEPDLVSCVISLQ